MSYSIQYLGHSAILITSLNGKKILVDPYLSDNEYASISPEDINELDAILVTHGAFDHLGDAFEIQKRTHAKLYSDAAVVNYAIARDIPKEETMALIYGTNIDHEGVQIRCIEAKHINHFKYDDHYVTGAALSFIIRLEDGTGIYFSGDTAIFSDMKFFGELYPVQIGFFCTSGLPGYAYEMDGKEAALSAKLFGVKTAVPVHCRPGSTEIDAFKEELARIAPEIEAHIMKPGDILEG